MKCTKGTLYQRTSKGIVPLYKRGRKLYFSKTELESWALDPKHRFGTLEELEQRGLKYCTN
ncbi:helix-turn-helix domain-containing protein [Lunatimonas lonarensis]|uniref:helix-turn-helix domain-containing protein n=1 Tax=Lunatimonas lonarensis TaxID=1232681 RepID=UPI00138AC53A